MILQGSPDMGDIATHVVAVGLQVVVFLGVLLVASVAVVVWGMGQRKGR
jgi:hypothetical protein